MFGFGIIPRGWAQCNGQTLSINQNEALFSLIGTIYGGDGVQTFALPNLQGQAPLHTGFDGVGNSYVLGQAGGATAVTLSLQQLPTHTHPVSANSTANTNTPANNTVPGGTGVEAYGSSPDTPMNAAIIGPAGSSQAHSNMQPYLVINFCIALSGIFPSRN